MQSKPQIWLTVLIAGLPVLAETVYTPTLPNISLDFATSVHMVEITLSIYLAGFAIGTFVWGKISDSMGRKPSLFYGFTVFLLGCIGCYLSNSIEILLLARLIQGFGGGAGSVLGQAIARDAFEGRELGKVYSTVGGTLAIFPAIGPIIGSLIAHQFGWQAIFLFLILCGIIVIIQSAVYLPETHLKANRKRVSTLGVARKLLTDKHVLYCAFMVGLANGINFSYYAEAPFILKNTLGLESKIYGLSFIPIAIFSFISGRVSKHLNNSKSSSEIITIGIYITLLAGVISSIINLSLDPLQMNGFLIFNTVVSQMIMIFGVSLIGSNSLAAALVNYKWCIGTASSLLGFGYYSIIAFCTFIMSLLHNSKIYTMSCYFVALSIIMITISRLKTKNHIQS